MIKESIQQVNSNEIQLADHEQILEVVVHNNLARDLQVHLVKVSDRNGAATVIDAGGAGKCLDRHSLVGST